MGRERRGEHPRRESPTGLGSYPLQSEQQHLPRSTLPTQGAGPAFMSNPQDLCVFLLEQVVRC